MSNETQRSPDSLHSINAVVSLGDTNEIEHELEKLKNYGDECNCECDSTLKLIFDTGEWDEIHTYCTNCGGYVVDNTY